MGQLIDGLAIAAKINAVTAQKAAELKTRNITPMLGVILVGSDPASVMYDKMKGEAAKKLGLEFVLRQFPETITEAELIAEIKTVQAENKLSGLIIQLPLPEHLYTPAVRNAIDPNIDVDFLTDARLGQLVMNSTELLPPTPGAVFSILDELEVKLTGKNVVIIGMGSLVGKPLAIMMANAKASVTTINSRTKDVLAKCLAADIIVSGVGKKNLVTANLVSLGAIVIDAGISFENKKVFGDVNVAEVLPIASFVTPTPGGLGPITVARLLLNTVLSAKISPL